MAVLAARRSPSNPLGAGPDMTSDTLLVFAILGAVILLFLSERFRLDLVALMAVLALTLTGLLTPAEALAGFSDPTVLIIAGLFVVGGGLLQTGVAAALGARISRLAGTNPVTLLAVIMVTVAVLSAFMSSTGTAAIFLPVVVSLAWNARLSPSKLLIPLAIASLIGGMLTLIGTPPNIVVSSYLAEQGLAPFGFFQFTPVGLVMLALGLGFMILVGQRLLPERGQRPAGEAGAEDAPSVNDLIAAYGLADEFFRLRVRRNSLLIGQRLAQANLGAHYGVIVLDVQSWPPDEPLPTPPRPTTPDTYIDEHDILRVQGHAQDIARLTREQSLTIRPSEEMGGRYLSGELGVVEVLLTPRSRLNGQTVVEAHFREKYGVNVLGLMRRGEPLDGSINATRLRFGDALLVQGTWQQIELLRSERRDFVIVGQPQEMIEMRTASGKAPLALLIMLGMLLVMTLGLLPTVTAVLLAAVLMVGSGCLSMEDAYANMNWESVVLIAGMLPIATALQKTGGVDVIAQGLTASLGDIGPLALMAGLFLLTSLFSQFISNTATTVLVAPIAFQAAAALGLSPYPILMTVAVAASTAFATPIASPVNTLVLGPGAYRFGDFARVGLPLQFLILLATLLIVPLLFPL